MVFSWLADVLALLPRWPVLYTVHAIMTAIALRSEPGGFQFAVENPIASCVMNIIVASSGTILANLMLARPLLDCVASEVAVGVGVMAWFLVYFSPGDTVYNLCNRTPVKVVLSVLEEVRRSRLVMLGVMAAAEVYPGSFLPQALTGMLKGTGKKWGVTLFRLVSGSQLASRHELVNLSFITKGGFSLGVLFSLVGAHHLRPEECVLLGAILLAGVKVYDIFIDSSHDPFLGPQQALWKVVSRRSSEPANGVSDAQFGAEQLSTCGSKKTKQERLTMNGQVKNKSKTE